MCKLETELQCTVSRLVRAEKDVDHWVSLFKRLVDDKVGSVHACNVLICV